MRRTLAAVLTAGLALAAISATAAPPRSKPVTAGPKTTKPPKITTSTPKSRPVTAGPKASSKASTPKTTTSAKPVKAPKQPKAPKTTAGTASTGTQGALTTKSEVPRNPKLAARLQAMLPAGMTVEQAALGFKNQGQFIAAVNIANNHGISFVDLKKSMVDRGLSLGQSIQQLKPSLDGEVEAARATRLAEQELEPR